MISMGVNVLILNMVNWLRILEEYEKYFVYLFGSFYCM